MLLRQRATFVSSLERGVIGSLHRESESAKGFALAAAPSVRAGLALTRETRALPRLIAFRGENGFRIGAGNSAYGDPAEATDKRAD